MQIRRIQVSDFRVLRDVDLTFGADFDPQIFPLGSKNGGGKSTLLQLVFVLLGCADHPERGSYLRDLLTSFVHPADQPEKHVATITVDLKATDDSSQTVVFEFESLNDAFLAQALGQDQGDSSFAGLASSPQMERERQVIAHLRDQLDMLLAEDHDPEIPDDAKSSFHASRRWEMVLAEYARLQERTGVSLPATLRKVMGSLQYRSVNERRSLVTELRAGLDEWEVRADASIERITHLLQARHLHLLTRFVESHGVPCGLICRVHGRDSDEARTVLQSVGEHIYLLGPTLQQYLFLPLEVRESLTHAEPDRVRRRARNRAQQLGLFDSRTSQRLTYLQALAQAEEELPGFHSYDWLSIEPLIELFRQARDRDFAMAVANGQYGDHYTRILADVNALLVDKRVQPEGDLSGLSFTVERPDGTESEIRLEDLSRGELKRLMIYAWLKTMGSGAVVLMDELEVSLHPDWQLHIIEDLHQWAPDNQYILATHSYELCQALTPGHVRELDPPLDDREQVPGPAAVKG